MLIFGVARNEGVELGAQTAGDFGGDIAALIR